jgi:hypothetical protein
MAKSYVYKQTSNDDAQNYDTPSPPPTFTSTRPSITSDESAASISKKLFASIIILIIALFATWKLYDQVEAKQNTHTCIKVQNAPNPSPYRIISYSNQLSDLFETSTKIETLVKHIEWAEGPIWFNNSLLFSDVKQNTIYQWKNDSTTTTATVTRK